MPVANSSILPELPMVRGSSDSAPAPDPDSMIRAIAASQDRAAFTDLFKWYAPRIKTVLMRTGTSREVAEEIAQEVLLTVWLKAAYYDPDHSSPQAWIYTIARNLLVDRYRGDRRAMRLRAHYHVLESNEAPSPHDVLDAAEREQKLLIALGQLSEAQKQVVQLSFDEGCAHGKIADVLGLPLGTVKSRLRLALNRLRELLGHPR
jgi:RNA polymerase sigma-70 factor, ECF subfamily